MDDLISRNALLAGIEELKESPWFNFGKADPNKIRHEWMEDGADFEVIGNVWDNPELLGGDSE